ncbi:hypothetical protein QK289_05385 [Exiguobacterium antarcticum]|uniref:ABC transporter permease n=1 Tax=Exiguobacterium antarcticum TaxID=132920 RepID=A0ABT6R290_9BACL|nr:hypothetical protein [Exiguobacterium antarcticum]MDI3234431.1 hypothetical protein [Exiguobacterium antarcticum]
MYKQLIRYHIKQGIWPLASFFLLAVFSYGFGSYTVIDNFGTYNGMKTEAIQSVLVSPSFAGFGAILIAVFAILILGQERGSGRSLMLHALPINKKTLYWVKWGLGVVVLLVLPLLGFFVSWLILQGLGGINPFDYVTLTDLAFDFLSYFLFDLVVFSIFLLAGTIAGDVIGQLLLGLFFLFLNYLTFFAIMAVVTLGLGQTEEDGSLFDVLMTTASPFTLLFQGEQLTSALLFHAVLLVILVSFGSLLYVRSENERLGRFTVFPKIHPFLIIVFSVYTTILLAAVIGIISSENQFLYWLAVAILVWPAFSSYRRMIGWKR